MLMSKIAFPSEFFIGNRRRLRELHGNEGLIVITGNGLIQRSTDESYPFKQDSNFWYLTGIDEPNAILVIDDTYEYLIAPELSHYQEVFDGGLSHFELAKISGLTQITTNKQGWELLSKSVKKSKQVATIPVQPSFSETYGSYTSPARAHLWQSIMSVAPDIKFQDISMHLKQMRMTKQDIELKMINSAITATIGAVNFVNKRYQAGEYDHEFNILLDINQQYWVAGANSHSFDPIIAGGERGLTLHISDKKPLDPSKQLLIDIGAEFNHYAADISRTFMKSPSKRFTQIKFAVCDVSDYAYEILKPGVMLRDYENKIQEYMGEKLRELGLIKVANQQNIRKYFPHATSHFLGLDVHDEGDYGQPIEAGVVLTVEPGIYIPEEGIGVRIEDDILITSDGCQNLSAKLDR